jgi:hypothetical protein
MSETMGRITEIAAPNQEDSRFSRRSADCNCSGAVPVASSAAWRTRWLSSSRARL